MRLDATAEISAVMLDNRFPAMPVDPRTAFPSNAPDAGRMTLLRTRVLDPCMEGFSSSSSKERDRLPGLDLDVGILKDRQAPMSKA